MATQSPNGSEARAAAVTPFGVDRRDLGDGCVRLRVAGELDLATADRLVGALDEALASRKHVILDLQPCTFVDSTGIAAILSGRRQLEEGGRTLCVVGARDGVERVLEITGLRASGLVKDDLKTALRACGVPAAAV